MKASEPFHEITLVLMGMMPNRRKVLTTVPWYYLSDPRMFLPLTDEMNGDAGFVIMTNPYYRDSR
jgi:hypothetical protein